jgi:hypothetical protein
MCAVLERHIFPVAPEQVRIWLRLFKKSGWDRARVEAVDRSFM